MKKSVLSIFLALAVISAVSGQAGVIREMTGSVELKPSGASAFAAASPGDQIAPDTIVSTGFRSTAIIAVGSSLITVRPLTRLSLAEIQAASGTENVNVSLQTGRVRVDVRPPSGTRTNFTVQSPSATASVRGTSFEFDTVNLSVTEGRVAFGGSAGASVIVDAGGASFVAADGRPADPAGVASASLLPPAPIGMPGTETLADSTSGAASGELFIIIDYGGR